MRSPLRTALAAAVLAAAFTAHPVFAQETILQNDGFIDGQAVGFQGGFVVGEMAGVRLTPPGPFPLQVTRVQFLFGGAAGQRTITLRIYDDPGPGSAPGVQLFFGDYQVTASNTALQEIDLTGDNVFVTGQFRVAIEFQHSGLPSVARDGDGTIQAARNFIYASIGSWFDSQLFGLTGDWVIRAGVTSGTPGPTDPPQILSVLDVGNDQGRQVRVRFERSAQDAAGAATPVTSYEVLRRQEFAAEPGRQSTGLRLDGWDYLTSVPAHGESIYSVIVPTLADSTIVNGMHWTAFLVRAATATPTVFFDSAPDSGYSLDNLAPGPPANLVADAGLVTWDPAPEADFDYFTVYGSDQPVLDPNAVQLAQTVATGFDATGLPYAYVLVSATDFAGNEGPAAAADAATSTPEPSARSRPALRAQPNPFTAGTTMSFDLPRAGAVNVSVHDAAGRLVRELSNGPRAAGRHEVEWDGRDTAGRRAASGVYFVRLEGDGIREERKVVRTR
jgi:hypothetical protein